MPDARYPAAIWAPGLNANYAAGRTSMTTAVCHYTVGRDSRPVGARGYFQFLVPRDGMVTQFAEADAVCWHGGSPWNQRGPGIEVEYLDEPTIFTPEAEAATGALVSWLHDEWGIPTEFYDGPRVADWHGFITHRSLIQTGDPHSDYWPHLPIAGDTDMGLELTDFDGIKRVVGGDPNLDGSIPTISQVVRDLQRLEKKVDTLVAAPPGSVALLPSDLDAIAEKVADKLAARLKD